MEARKFVLVIDQHRAMRETLTDVFAKRPDYHLLNLQEAQDFDDAEELINSVDLDVLVADVLTRRTPIGKELIERAMTKHPKLAVVLVSADPALYAENYPKRAVCLQKPFSADQLLAAIDEATHAADTDH